MTRHTGPRHTATHGFPSLLILASAGLLGCTGDPSTLDLPPADALRLQFPLHAAEVLQRDDAFVATDQGFTVVPAPSGEGGFLRLTADLPRDGAAPLRMRPGHGGEIEVREIGAMGEGTVAERAIAYRRAGRTSFWTVIPGGMEEWLYLEAGAVQPGEPVAKWEVTGAILHQNGAAVDLVDESGAFRMRVTAPVAYTESGREAHAMLSVEGSTLVLSVDAAHIAGEALLVDPAWVTTASMNEGRYKYTATRLGNGKVIVTGGHDYEFPKKNGGALRSRVEYVDVRHTHAEFTFLAHSHTAGRRKAARDRGLVWAEFSAECGSVRSGDRSVDGHRSAFQ